MNFTELLASLPRVVTAAEMAAIDRYTIDTLGLPGRVLMENAGRAVFELLRAHFHPLARKRAAVFCGKGNNGGDGFVIARLLNEAGVDCDTFFLGKKNDLPEDARANFLLLERLGNAIHALRAEGPLPDLTRYDFLIDALLGTGVRGALQGTLAQLVQHLNHSERPLIAVDLPTGMNADTGAVEGPCLRARMTVTLGARKQGLLFSPGREHAGELHVVDIGFPAIAYEMAAGQTYLLQRKSMSQWLPERANDAFKNRVGQILVIAGSRGFGGAARLTATAALRAGAGLVVLAAPESLLTAIEAATAEVIKLPLPEHEGAIASDAINLLHERLGWANVVALGPGLGTSAAAKELVRHVLRTFTGIVVLDADGINVLAGELEILHKSASRIILTPHPGELKRLLSYAPTWLAEAPIATARRVAKELGHVLVLKGAPTVIGLPSEEVLINSTGNAGMATAGSGDVLSGLIAGLAGQGLAPAKAASLGVYLHGLAGDFECKQLGMWSMLASDILNQVPQAFLQIAAAR